MGEIHEEDFSGVKKGEQTCQSCFSSESLSKTEAGSPFSGASEWLEDDTPSQQMLAEDREATR